MSQNSINISHLYKDEEWHIQSNEEHCKGVAEIAAHFASEIGMEEWGYLIGLLHDRGKESDGFQAYIRRNSGYHPTAYSSSPKEHSFIGAIIAHKHPYDCLYWLSNAIAGHHGGLYNIDELDLILKKEIPEEVSGVLPEIKFHLPSFRLSPKETSHVSRMLFSCLVDADWLDTESFMQPATASARGNFSSLEELEKCLDQYCQNLKSRPSTFINDLRNEIQAKCKSAASLNPGFFDLTVPTGGGKTVASIIWAMRHALIFNKKRIIVAIPYTSIIVQTAAQLRLIFGDENVVEHHSALNDVSDDNNVLLACENWDAPIIVTTNVQFFESIFSNRRTTCRKLHSIANSVVILDEIQTLPLHYLQPIVDAMSSYVKLFGTSFLFSTASQPILDGERKGGGKAIFKGIAPDLIRPIIGEDMQLHKKLRRVIINIDQTPHTYETLSDIIKRNEKVLCIVSSRKHALEMYKKLSEDKDIPTYHLSRSMCPAHILATINKIKCHLLESKDPIRVVSTQLIEAGVDLDFPVVYRQLSGLDSILQASGRCNREGKSEKGYTTIFSFKDDSQSSTLRFASDTMRDMMTLYPDADWFDPSTVRLYYEKLYHRIPSFDKYEIGDLLGNGSNCQFEEASNKFRLIEDSGINIIVNFGDSERLINELVIRGPSRKLSRQLGRFSVSLPHPLFNEYWKAGLIEEPRPGFFFIRLKDQYDGKTGLKTKNELTEKFFII